LSRSVTSVPQLWQEWQSGLDGQPSVRSLEDTHGPRWRTSQADRKFYSRRKVVIDKIDALISE
ncbi:transcriptional activator of glycolytic enzymes-domain-containing protein, partial [Geopyxis carbonaria]